jgi:Fe-S-cluster containining protein
MNHWFLTMKQFYDRPYFFDKAIRFECRQCGICCTGSPGTVYADSSDVLRIAEFLNIPSPVFIQDYLYPFRNSYSIKEDAEGRCLFFNEGCTIYPVRPLQCKTFPFWFENLRSEQRWQRICSECPGIGDGTLYSKEQILEIVQLTFKPKKKARQRC